MLPKPKKGESDRSATRPHSGNIPGAKTETIFSMKRCDYCGRENDDTVAHCPGCGSSDFTDESGEKLFTELRRRDLNKLTLTPPAKRDSDIVILKCRTPGEAYLVRYELESAEIMVLLPGHEELLADYKHRGFVELQVAAGACGSATDLRKAVEFQYKRLRGEQSLSNAARAVAVSCALMIVPGLLVFLWLLSSYRTNGYHRMATEFKLFFFVGLASSLLAICSMSIYP